MGQPVASGFAVLFQPGFSQNWATPGYTMGHCGTYPHAPLPSPWGQERRLPVSSTFSLFMLRLLTCPLRRRCPPASKRLPPLPHVGGGEQPAFPPEGGEGPSGSEAPSEAGDESGTGDASWEGMFPFQHALDLLAKNSPDLVATSQRSQRCLSAAERALGCSFQQVEPLHALCASQLLTDVVQQVESEVRGTDSSMEVVGNAAPSFPNALTCGKYLRPERLPFSARPSLLSDSPLPSGQRVVSPEDLLLLPERLRSSPRSACLSDKV